MVRIQNHTKAFEVRKHGLEVYDFELFGKWWDCSIGTTVDGWGGLDVGMERSTLNWSVCVVWEDWIKSKLGWGERSIREGWSEPGCGKFKGCVMGIRENLCLVIGELDCLEEKGLK